MKKIAIGSILYLTAIIAVVLLLNGSMPDGWDFNRIIWAARNLYLNGLMPVLCGAIVLGIPGFIIALIGLCERKKQ